jgi:hypothetical protein
MYLVIHNNSYEGGSYTFDNMAELARFLDDSVYDLDEYSVYRIEEELNAQTVVDAYISEREKAVEAAKSKLTQEERELLGIT